MILLTSILKYSLQAVITILFIGTMLLLCKLLIDFLLKQLQAHNELVNELNRVDKEQLDRYCFSPEQIRQMTFAHAQSGYNCSEVRQLLEDIASSLENSSNKEQLHVSARDIELAEFSSEENGYNRHHVDQYLDWIIREMQDKKVFSQAHRRNYKSSP